jgi:hypothetical protein
MKAILTLKARLYSRDGAVYGSGDPFLYDVQGLAAGETAEIYKVGERWRYRRMQGKLDLESALEFATAQEALAALQEEV